MATAAKLVPGATPTHSAHGDPFVSTPSPYQSAQVRYATLDNDHFTSYSTNSPAQARRALEAHLKETNRRMQDAAKLGATLVKQRDTFTARLKELEAVSTEDEVPDSLRQKLSNLEKEYNEVGRESARAFLPKLRPSNDATTLTAQGGSSPSKVSAPSRRQRNQPGARVHDIEFATEISTSLLAQVRQLQSALADKDATLKSTAANKAQLEADVADLSVRVKQMGDRSQSFKDENWNLETRIQELESALKTSTDNHTRLGQSLSSTQAEKLAALKDLDELKLAHDKAIETHATDKKQLDQDLHALKRDLATHEAEKNALQKQIAELNSNNKELARAVSYRLNQPSEVPSVEDARDLSDDDQDTSMMDNLDMSPIKGTPARPGMLESETLKSSLNHAHRMIQNLKNNIHREKTEKLELKRMLNDARDELEKQTGDGARTASDKASRRRNGEGKSRRMPRIGANGQVITTTELLDDPEWEDNDEQTGTLPQPDFTASGAASRATSRNDESTDAFETADERRETTETEGFETGHEAFDDDSDELTETERGLNRSITIRKRASQSAINPSSAPGDRRSFLSTASTSNSEDDAESFAVRTPSQSQGPKYRLKKSNRRSGRYSQHVHESPASNNSTPQNVTQTLGDELDGLDDVSIEGTPSKMRDISMANDTPETARTSSAVHSPIKDEEDDVDQTVLVNTSPLVSRTPKPAMVDAGVMTEVWQPQTVGSAVPIPAEPEATREEPEPVTPKRSFSQRVAGVAGGALAGFGLGRVGKESESAKKAPVLEAENRSPADTKTPVPSGAPEQQLSFSPIVSEDYEPIEVPQAAESGSVIPLLPKRSSKRPDLDESSILPGLPAAYSTIPSTEPMSNSQADAENIEPGHHYVEPKVYGGGKGANGIPTLVVDDNGPDKVVSVPAPRRPLEERSPNISSQSSSVKEDSVMTKPLHVKKPMLDEGSQTTMSGDEIEDMIRNKANLAADLGGDALADGSLDASSPKRPGSSGSTRNRSSTPAPPLPPDHTEKIAAAAKTPVPAIVPGSMGPPLLPASAYRNKNRPITPADRATPRSMSRDGTTPRAVRTSVREPSLSGRLSHRSSVSSFASELDVRFNINREHLMYPDDIQPATDPRMIQAITQTMIGEWLWKYTRKAGRSDTSTTRHKRFFWVHPYTRTLYWGESDPSTASKSMMKAKSVPIEAVRVISDNNVNPPGLHRKSLVVVTPSREIVMTAPTSQRHETWINALSYLLLKTEAEKEEADNDITEEDLEEFNPSETGFSIRRSFSRMARGRSHDRQSMRSYTSRATTRNSSPTGRAHRESTMSERPNTAQRSQSSAPNVAPAGSTASRSSKVRDSSRFSSMASRFGTARGSIASVAQQPPRAASSLSSRKSDAGVYGGTPAMAESAEDVRQTLEKRERDAELENVRACCDGKHDVGSLSRTSRHLSLKSRVGGSHSHSHSHA